MYLIKWGLAWVLYLLRGSNPDVIYVGKLYMLRTLFAYILNQSAPPHSDFTVMSSAVRITILIPD